MLPTHTILPYVTACPIACASLAEVFTYAGIMKNEISAKTAHETRARIVPVPAVAFAVSGSPRAYFRAI